MLDMLRQTLRRHHHLVDDYTSGSTVRKSQEKEKPAKKDAPAPELFFPPLFTVNPSTFEPFRLTQLVMVT